MSSTLRPLTVAKSAHVERSVARITGLQPRMLASVRQIQGRYVWAGVPAGTKQGSGPNGQC